MMGRAGEDGDSLIVHPSNKENGTWKIFVNREDTYVSREYCSHG